MNNAGTYTITYTATDAAGNIATATRTVTVRNDAYYLAGTYTTTETGSSPWQQTITVSTTENNKIKFSRFANYDNNDDLTANVVTVSGSQYVRLSPSTQTATGIGNSGCDHKFIASGTDGSAITLVGGKYTFSVKFTDETTGPGAPNCNPTSPLPYEDTFVQN
jgi:Tfp pilus assembly protein FimT